MLERPHWNTGTAAQRSAVPPRCFSRGETVEDALANLREALELYFEDAPTPVESAPMVTSVDVRLSA
ncbi:type II toxin-antitoxin system HicB family antitoxin [Haloactinospora alba]|uniref:type II toxin-antitoxin system HicB family antitoxin n=1 Tax=Haloactinospora alba TaxID=405555 RepID=UPI00114D6D64|nr:type II toxin-antitoxin system HicB family antitoxin [Haloactinospora alba]